jgi:site-specific DNA recombinase
MPQGYLILAVVGSSNPIKKRKEVLDRESTRQQKSIERLLDAYQEDLLELEDLRRRLPNLRKRSESLQSELRSLEAATGDRQALLRLADNLENFLER